MIDAFKAGATPEAIVQSYSTLKLADVYAVVGRYLADPRHLKHNFRVPDLDIESVQDANLSGSSDPTILAWAARENRVLLTHVAASVPARSTLSVTGLRPTSPRGKDWRVLTAPFRILAFQRPKHEASRYVS